MHRKRDCGDVCSVLDEVKGTQDGMSDERMYVYN